MRGKRFAALLLALVLCVFATACTARQSKYGSAFRFPLCAEPAQLDPQMADDAASVEILTATMEGLTRLSETGEVLPGIAAEWRTSGDGKTVTFTLREATWSDGTPVTADDFAFAFARAVDPATRSPLKSKFANIASAEATDTHTFKVTLNAADEAFPRTMANTAFYPCNRTFFEKSAGHYGMEAEYLLTDGGFTLSSWSHGEYLILRKNAQYYAQEEILPDAVRYVIGADESDVAHALSSEALSGCAVPSGQEAAVKRAGFATATVYDGMYGLWLNAKADGLSNAATRRALCAAVDREKAVEMLEKEEKRVATGFVPPDVTCGGAAYVSETDTFGDVQSEKKTLSALPQLTLLCGEDELSVSLAQRVLQSWQKRFSLYFKMEKLPENVLADRIQSGDYQLALGTVVSTGGTAGEALAAFSSGNSGNVTGFSDKTFDGLLKEALAADTKAAYQKAEARLLVGCPCLPLYYPARTFAFGDGVEGVTVHPFGGSVYGAVYDFRKATK